MCLGGTSHRYGILSNVNEAMCIGDLGVGAQRITIGGYSLSWMVYPTILMTKIYIMGTTQALAH